MGLSVGLFLCMDLSAKNGVMGLSVEVYSNGINGTMIHGYQLQRGYKLEFNFYFLGYLLRNTRHYKLEF